MYMQTLLFVVSGCQLFVVAPVILLYTKSAELENMYVIRAIVYIYNSHKLCEGICILYSACCGI